MVRLRRHALGLGLVAALVAAGCGGEDDDNDKRSTSAGDNYTIADVKRFAITKSDLPDGYETEERKTSSSPEVCLSVEGNDAAESSLKREFTALGFKGCAGSSFRKKVSSAITKNNRPAGLAILMRDENAAAKALPLLRRALLGSFTTSGTADTFKPHSIPAPMLGDEAPRGVTLTGELGPQLGSATFYLYVWRRGNVVAWIGSSDILGDFDRRSTLALARKLDARGAR